jgi:hypothetical protein
MPSSLVPKQPFVLLGPHIKSMAENYLNPEKSQLILQLNGNYSPQNTKSPFSKKQLASPLQISLEKGCLKIIRILHYKKFSSTELL